MASIPKKIIRTPIPVKLAIKDDPPKTEGGKPYQRKRLTAKPILLPNDSDSQLYLVDELNILSHIIYRMVFRKLIKSNNPEVQKILLDSFSEEDILILMEDTKVE